MPLIEDSITLSVEDEGDAGLGITGHYAKATITATTSGDKVNYTIEMSTKTAVSGQNPAVTLYLAIDGQGIYDKYFHYTKPNGDNNPNDPRYETFPTGNKTSKTGSITLKDANDTSIPIDIRICAGQYASVSKNELTSRLQQKTGTLTRTSYTEVGTGKTTITDNYNNTFTITATKGSNGTGNTGTLDNLKYSYDNTDYDKSYTSGSAINLSISGTSATRTVYAKSRTKATYGNSKTATANKDIKQYIAPSAPGVPALTDTSKQNGRLTTRNNWTFTWTAATKTNSSSPVKGYRVALKKNGESIPIIDANGKTISSNPSKPTWHSWDTTGRTLTINPAECGFKPGDTVQVGVKPFTRYGNNNDGDVLLTDDYTYSTTTTVQKAAVVHVNKKAPKDKDWTEGIVYVNISNTSSANWVEATEVAVNVSGAWKPST